MSSAIRIPWAVLAGVILLAGCRTSAGNVPAATAEARLTGTVNYRERIALPPEATVEVRLEDVSRADAPATVIAEQKVVTAGRQVPIPFELHYPPGRIEANHRYALRAEIRGADGALLFATATHHPVLAAGAPAEAIRITVQGVTSNAAPETVTPWAAAARRGVRFRALGNEPSWVLEITDKLLVMITDLGKRRTEFPFAEPVVMDQTTIWRSAGSGEGMVAVVHRARCVDGMSGEEFEASAAVTFGGAVYKGCGRFLK